MNFSQAILAWYSVNKRDLPWRTTRDAYKIWLSEIMLQQTRVAQGLPYYERFLKKFPTVFDLANANEEEVLKLWQGLGYYSRARNLHATAKNVVENYKGNFPDNYKELLKLKGVGDYTASAIASICFDEAEPVVDGNVYRVLARYYGVDIPINSTKGIKYFKTLARKVISKDNVRDYNQGIMEFGAMHCAPKKPLCTACPLQKTCVAFNTNQVHVLPVKEKKIKIKQLHFNYVVPLVDYGEVKHTVLLKRQGKGIWQNLYEFPLIESAVALDVSSVQQEIEEKLRYFEKPFEINLFNAKPIVHKLSHQHLHTKFWIVHLSNLKIDTITWEEIHNFPVPILIADFLKKI